MSAIRTPGGDVIREEDGPIGLALSGSGLKASLFHIGVLARLAELDLLRRIDVLSGSGGGALISALYHLRLKRALDADGDIGTDRLIRMVAALQRDFLTAVQTTDLRAGLSGSLLSNLKRVRAQYSDSSRFGDLLERHLFRPVWAGDPGSPIELRELAIHPRGDRDFNPATDNRKRYCKASVLIINAADLGTGRAWRFDAERMGEPAMGPATRRLSETPLLAESVYRRLPEVYAGMTLGYAVAASMAAPGVLEPLELPRLYRDPKHSNGFLDVRLACGHIADAFGTDALLERGCRQLIVSDGSGFPTSQAASSVAGRARQLEALEAARPGGIVLIHLLSEIETLEVTPVGPIGRSRIVKDREDDDVTSYGVERRLQKLIASMRADVDAPSETEAVTLMADGYLIAKRAFQRLRLSGQTWAEGPTREAEPWHFSAVAEALRQPSKKLVKHLQTAELSTLRGPRLSVVQTIGLGLFTCVATLTLVALGAFWSALRPAVGERLWTIATAGFLLLAAALLIRRLFVLARGDDCPAWLAAVVNWIGKGRSLTTALPLLLASRFRRRASRAFLRAGRLKRAGIEPVATKKRRRRAASSDDGIEETAAKAA